MNILKIYILIAALSYPLASNCLYIELFKNAVHPLGYRELKGYLTERISEIRQERVNNHSKWSLKNFLTEENTIKLMRYVFHLEPDQRKNLFQHVASQAVSDNEWSWQRAFLAAFAIGSNIDFNQVIDDSGATLLQKAAIYQDTELAEILLRYGACPLLGHRQDYPLHRARKAPLAKLLVDHAADQAMYEETDTEALFQHCVNGSVEAETLELYLEKNLHKKLPSKSTIVHCFFDWMTQHTQLNFFKTFFALYHAGFFESTISKIHGLTLTDKIERNKKIAENLIMHNSLMTGNVFMILDEKKNVIELAGVLIAQLDKKLPENFKIPADQICYKEFIIPIGILSKETRDFLQLKIPRSLQSTHLRPVIPTRN